MYIRAADVAAHGYANGCGRCGHALRYGAGMTTKLRSEACRGRFNEDLAKKPMGRLRLGVVQDRMEISVAEHVEEHDTRRVTTDVAT